MLTLLIYLGLAVAVGAAVFSVAWYGFGRDEMAAPPLGPSTTRLPRYAVTGEDLRRVRFDAVVRGYRPSDVDWVLGRAAAELDALRGDVARLRILVAELDRRS